MCLPWCLLTTNLINDIFMWKNCQQSCCNASFYTYSRHSLVTITVFFGHSAYRGYLDYTNSYVYVQNCYRESKLKIPHYCSAWPRLKLNAEIGLHTHHPPPHKLLGINSASSSEALFSSTKGCLKLKFTYH